MLTDHLKELWASSEIKASSRGQVETGPAFEADLKSPEDDDPTSSEIKSPVQNVPADPDMQSPKADIPAINNPEIDKIDADTPGADKKHFLRRDWFFRTCEVMLFLTKLIIENISKKLEPLWW